MARNRPTKYKVVITKNEKELMKLGTSEKRTKRALYEILLANGPEVDKLVTKQSKADDYTFDWDKDNKAIRFTTGHIVKFEVDK